MKDGWEGGFVMTDYVLAYLNDEMSLDMALKCVRDKIFGGGLSASEAAMYREQNEQLQFHATVHYMRSLGYELDDSLKFFKK